MNEQGGESPRAITQEAGYCPDIDDVCKYKSILLRINENGVNIASSKSESVVKPEGALKKAWASGRILEMSEQLTESCDGSFCRVQGGSLLAQVALLSHHTDFNNHNGNELSGETNYLTGGSAPEEEENEEEEI